LNAAVRITKMKTSTRIIAACFVSTVFALFIGGTRAGEKESATGSIIFDWTIVNKTFHVEVKNATKKVFVLDELFAEGFNVVIIGLDSRFEQVYRTMFGVDLKRAPATLIKIAPGNYHRTAYRIEHYLKTLPRNVKYIKLKWTRNYMGTKLPKAGLSTSIYELRRDPDKPAAGAGK